MGSNAAGSVEHGGERDSVGGFGGGGGGGGRAGGVGGCVGGGGVVR